MKGFFAFILDALRDVDVTKLKKPLYILATADEETSMAGARYFAETTALRPDCAIIGEPTSLQPVRAHKGHISNAIRIQGQSGHSSDPARGVNAIELMHDAIGHILQLRDNLKERYHYEAFTVPYPTLNLGHIHGGDASNRICACCELHMDIRPLPGMTLNELNGLLNDALAPVSERWPGRLTVDELHPPIPGYECPPNHQLVEVVEKLLGAKTEVVNYCTEAPFIQTLCPTLVLGPGSINQAHQPDEYLETRFIKPTRELITQVIHHFCWH
ncbi:acetylornithine deacetylase [Escherichia coli 3-105-05_S1_C3]|jgi:acetylornithine deacetylase|nr:acetylornithine deacetylase [Escherichia coli 2-460-02_S3_C2]KDZ78356.1 acetylornithine deacetylase [Escherichia coli 3-105-05_S1_C3]SQD07826.1 acetylornithine deacetylase [Escherichia coli]